MALLRGRLKYLAAEAQLVASKSLGETTLGTGNE